MEATDSSSALSEDLTDTVSVLLNNGDGTFQPRVDYSTGVEPIGITAADLTGDGILDLVSANAADSSISVLMGNGDGTFQPRVDFPAGAGAHELTVADLNGDGIPDLVTSNVNTDTISVLSIFL